MLPSRRLRPAASLVATGLLLALFAGSLHGGNAPAGPATVSMQLAGSHTVGTGSFRLSGSVHGLYPGGSVTLPLTVTNPNPFGLLVDGLRITVDSATSSCASRHVLVTPGDEQFVVPARAQVRRQVPVLMGAAAPDACQRVSFRLLMAGRAMSTQPEQAAGRSTPLPGAVAGALPRTGAFASALLLLGVALVLAGGVLALLRPTPASYDRGSVGARSLARTAKTRSTRRGRPKRSSP